MRRPLFPRKSLLPEATKPFLASAVLLFALPCPGSAQPQTKDPALALSQAFAAFAPPDVAAGTFAAADAPAATAAPGPTAPRPEAVPAPERRPYDGGRVAIETHISLIVNKSKNVHVPAPFSEATVASPAIADVVPISDRQFYILGKKIGQTNVLLYDDQKRLIGVVDVDVKLDIGTIGAEVREGSGGSRIRVREVNDDILLGGDAGDAQTAERAMTIAESLKPPGGRVVNAMRISTPQQVELKVRFVEASRSAVKNLGVRWNAFWHNGNSGAVVGEQQSTTKFGGAATAVNADVVPGAASGVSPFATILTQIINSRTGSLDMVLSALEEQQVVRRLAEPNLVALSGQSAEFLAGGEFPVPVSSTTGVGGAPTVTIDYKEFGVRLKFTPTVLGDGVISLKLEPEVSDLDPTISVSTGGVTVPGIVERRADTSVELRDGQSFAIAGLMSAKSQRTLDAFPWLGTVPVLGSLFSDKAFQQDETELVVIVSPHLVKPVPPGKVLKTPLDASLPGNDIDMFLNGKLEVPKSPPTYVKPNGVEQSLAGGMAPGAPGVPPAHDDPNRWHWPWEQQ